VDSRLRSREVCRGWRAFLADARHWQVLDLSLSSGVARRTLALLRALVLPRIARLARCASWTCLAGFVSLLGMARRR